MDILYKIMHIICSLISMSSRMWIYKVQSKIFFVATKKKENYDNKKWQEQ